MSRTTNWSKWRISLKRYPRSLSNLIRGRRRQAASACWATVLPEPSKAQKGGIASLPATARKVAPDHVLIQVLATDVEPPEGVWEHFAIVNGNRGRHTVSCECTGQSSKRFLF